jgi:hypothetical protein
VSSKIWSLENDLWHTRWLGVTLAAGLSMVLLTVIIGVKKRCGLSGLDGHG